MPTTNNNNANTNQRSSINKTNNSIQSHKNITNTQSTLSNTVMNNNSSDGFSLVTSKRNLSSSSQTLSLSDHTHNNKLQNSKKIKLFKSANRFQILTQEDSIATPPPNTDTIDDSLNDVFKPFPPIFVRGVNNYLDLSTALIELIGVDNFFCKASADRLKIPIANPESYRTLIHFLKEQEAKFHTYQLKEDKPLRVVIRNLHPTMDPNIIKEELVIRLFDVRRVTNVLHKVTKVPLPLFSVDLEPNIKSNDIFQLTSLLYTKIKVEESYKPKTLSQCNNCQEYDYTKPTAATPQDVFAVVLVTNLPTRESPNQRSDPPKCALCSGNHPFSHKGYSIYKDLQRAKRKPFTSSNLV